MLTRHMSGSCKDGLNFTVQPLDPFYILRQALTVYLCLASSSQRTFGLCLWFKRSQLFAYWCGRTRVYVCREVRGWDKFSLSTTWAWRVRLRPSVLLTAGSYTGSRILATPDRIFPSLKSVYQDLYQMFCRYLYQFGETRWPLLPLFLV